MLNPIWRTLLSSSNVNHRMCLSYTRGLWWVINVEHRIRLVRLFYLVFKHIISIFCLTHDGRNGNEKNIFFIFLHRNS
jgi:hypothetical protein